MKITDLTLTLFSWDIPQGRYPGQAISYGDQEIAVITIHSDEGVDGYSFLGSSMRGADMDAKSLLIYLKPALMDQNPLDIGRLWHEMWRRNRSVSLRAIGALLLVDPILFLFQFQRFSYSNWE